MHKNSVLLILVSGIMLALLSMMPITAQGDVVVISIAMPELIAGQISQDVFDQFEAAHPNIRIHRVNEGEFTYGLAAPLLGVDDFLDSVADYVTVADVLAVTPDLLTPEATRAGYYLDLTPLITSDPDLNPDDFYSVMYQSYQWDQGFWALPASTDVVTLVYQPDAFDQAGIEYPQSWWTIDDFENAARELAEYDNNGNVTAPAFVDFSGNTSLIFMSLLGHGLYDDSVIPSAPAFTDPMLEAIVTRWSEMQEDGVIGLLASADLELTPPMALAPSLFAYNPAQDTENQIATLPGGAVGLNVNGFGISAGTQYPQEAYELIKFLTASPEVSNAFLPTVLTGRRSIADVEIENEFADLFAVPQEMIDAVIENGIPVSETRFGRHINSVLGRIAQEDTDVLVALQDAEVEVMERLQAASDRAEDVVIVVDTPPEVRSVEEGQVSIRFGMDLTSLEGIPHREIWDEVIAEFVAEDPQVGEVVLETPNPLRGIELINMSESFDCYYLLSNVVQSANVEHLLSVDPLMASDPNFDANDYPATVLQQVQRDGRAWAIPLVIQPEVMAYNPRLLDQANAPYPYEGWTTVDFENTLRSLKIDPEDPAPYVSLDVAGSYIFGLIASYGGLPLDFRTHPVAVDFTSDENMAAIRQVLDLAKDGYIQYNALSKLSFSGLAVDIEDSQVPLFSILVNEFFFDVGASDTFAMVEFPQGQTYTSLIYDLGAAYISVNTMHAEACYRFISKVSDHPELFTGMPARQSQLFNPQLETSQGATATAFYQRLGELVSQPNAVLFPTGLSNNIETIQDFLMYSWLFRAFDRYILEDADLEQELEEAEIYTIGFQQCVGDFEPYDASDNIFGYFRQYTDCALQVDPSMEGTFISF